ncbi:hypothetical protein ACFWXA_30880 [Streptomyces atroolivaceus]|uniref:hypothetical protein n=1 Tax=Streptomyces atroolivaceus TaxID=66869 RepID=UPI003664DBDA
MINAAEASIEASAEDDAERRRIRAKLYAPPKNRPQQGGRRSRPPQMQMNALEAQALAAQLEAEDNRLAGRRSG